MKKINLLALAVAAGVILFACNSKEPGPDPNGGGGSGSDTPPVTIEEPMFTGSVKAGFAAAIEIVGDGFDPDLDDVYVGYTDASGTLKHEIISPDLLTVRTSRVSFGVPVTAGYLDKTVKVYLARTGYDDFKLISGDITFTLPSVAEGYIPDAGFRATLMSESLDEGNPNIAKLFDTYGMLDVAAAAKVKSSGCRDDHGLNLYGSAAKSLEGIELFTGIERAKNIAGWNMSQIEEIDLSNWKVLGVALQFSGLNTLKKFVGPPYALLVNVSNCPNLESVDLGKARWTYNLQLYGQNEKSNSKVTFLDIRRQRTGKEHTGDENKDYPYDPDNDYAIFLPGARLRVGENCTIWVDYQFLLDKRGQTEGGDGYATIYKAWKDHKAKIEVYDSKDITKHIGTVPMSSEDPGALTLTGDNGWKPEI